MGTPFEVRLDKLNQFATSLENTRNPTKVIMSVVRSIRVKKAVFENFTDLSLAIIQMQSSTDSAAHVTNS